MTNEYHSRLDETAEEFRRRVVRHQRLCVEWTECHEERAGCWRRRVTETIERGYCSAPRACGPGPQRSQPARTEDRESTEMAGKNKRRKPKKVTCVALRKDGLPCRAAPFEGFERCLAHEPKLEEYHSYTCKVCAWKRQRKKGIVYPRPVYRGTHPVVLALGEEAGTAALEEIRTKLGMPEGAENG